MFEPHIFWVLELSFYANVADVQSIMSHPNALDDAQCFCAPFARVTRAPPEGPARQPESATCRAKAQEATTEGAVIFRSICNVPNVLTTRDT